MVDTDSSDMQIHPLTARSGRRIRVTKPCDGCALRRVRCEGGRPCRDCQKRKLDCTFLRISKKRGPKGPRIATTEKILRAREHDLSVAMVGVFSDSGAQNSASTPSRSDNDVIHSGTSTSGSPPCYAGGGSLGMGSDLYLTPLMGNEPSPRVFEGPMPKHRPQPMVSYRKFLDVFTERLYPVWPVLCAETVVSRLSQTPNDYDNWALAASVCASVISQLRLPEHTHARISSPSSCGLSPSSSRRGSTAVSTSHDFAADAACFREQYDFKERPTISSLLTSFFLHVYCANSELLSTAGFHLRESLTQAHVLGLHRTASYASISPSEREIRLRVYWVLFVSERTFCVQRGLPTILKPISLQPSPDEAPDGCSASPILSFLHLTKLFTFLDGDLIEPPSEIEVSPQSSSSGRVPGDSTPSSSSAVNMDLQKSQEKVRNKIDYLQSSLGHTAEGVGLDETQRVDISVTRYWIRVLLWEYTIRHFHMSSNTENEAFSILLPAFISHEMLGFFSGVSDASIMAHGFGMELKVFRIADSLLDVVSCRRQTGQDGGMLVGSRDALHSLERVLDTLGGSESVFLNKLRGRMAELELPLPQNNTLLSPAWSRRKPQASPYGDRRWPPQREVEDVTTSDEALQ